MNLIIQLIERARNVHMSVGARPRLLRVVGVQIFLILLDINWLEVSNFCRE